MSEKKSLNQKVSMAVMLLIPIGIAVNFVGAQITHLLKLPVYLDVIGTILVGGLCGPMFGGITGALTNCLTSIPAPTELPYAIVNMSIGIVAGFAGRKYAFRSIKGTLIAGICIWAITQITVNPITAILYGGASGVTGGSIITTFLIATGKGLWQSVITSALITETVDKFISAFVVYFIIKSIPDRTKLKFPLGNFYIKQKPTDAGSNN